MYPNVLEFAMILTPSTKTYTHGTISHEYRNNKAIDISDTNITGSIELSST